MSETDSDVTLADYVRVLKRYWWAAVLLVLASTVAAFAISYAQHPKYRTAAVIRYNGVYTDSTQLAIQLQSVNQALSLGSIESGAAAAFGGPLPNPAHYTISAAPATVSADRKVIAATINSSTNLVAVTAQSGSAWLSASLANAFSRAFVDHRTQLVRASAKRSIAVVRAQIASVKQSLSQKTVATQVAAAQLLSLTQQLSQYEATATSGTGGWSVELPARPPTAPFSPRPIRNAVFGFGGGLFLVVILAILMLGLGNRAISVAQVTGLVGLPLLGRLPSLKEEQSENGKIVSFSAPASAAAEAYRRLRASLCAVLASEELKTLLFAGAREGEGVSAAVTNTALALARTGWRVVVIDADLRRPSLHAYLNVPNDEGVTSVATGRASLSEALQPVDIPLNTAPSSVGSVATTEQHSVGSVRVLTSGPGVADPGEVVAGQAMTKIIKELKVSADIILVNAPGLLDSADASALASAVDGVVLVVDPEVSSPTALKECKDYLDLMTCRRVGFVIREKLQRQSRRRAPQRRTGTPDASEPAVHTVAVGPED